MSDEEEEEQDCQSHSSDEDSMDSWYYESSEYAREQRYIKRQIRKERKNGFKPREEDAILYDEVRRQLETNDPDIERDIYTGRILLWMSKHYWPYDKDWEGAGKAIGNNIHLEEMHIGMTQQTDHEMNYNTKEQFISFWTGVSNNTSIDKLTIWNYNLLGGRKFFTVMKPFIRQLTELHIERADVNAKGASALASVLSEKNSLANLTIGGGRSRDELGVGFDDPFTAEGWTSFVRCLQSPHCKLTSLTIMETSMDDTTASVLAQGLKCNPYLKEFHLHEGITYLPSEEDDRLLTTAGWTSILSALQTNCGIKHVNLTKEKGFELRPGVDEDAVIALSNALSVNRTLRLGHNETT